MALVVLIAYQKRQVSEDEAVVGGDKLLLFLLLLLLLLHLLFLNRPACSSNRFRHSTITSTKHDVSIAIFKKCSLFSALTLMDSLAIVH